MISSNLKLVVLAGIFLAQAGCAQVPTQTDSAPEAAPTTESKATDEETKSDLPVQELTAQALYQYLVGEIALQRGQPELATEALLDLAKSSRDRRLAQRATETAVQARQLTKAVEAAELWQSLAPSSLQARQAAAALLLGSGQIEMARPHLDNLMATQGDARGHGFLQLDSMLSRQADKEAVLNLVREVAEPYPDLPEAHFAVAQAAIKAGKFELARSELAQAERLRPGWDAAVLLNGQILQQQGSVSEAIAYYRANLKKRPKAGQIRLALARLLVSDKQYQEARVEFQLLVKDSPNDPDVAFAIGILSMQEGDLETADVYLQKALANGHKEDDLVRFYLGQVAEERKQFDAAERWFRSVTQGEQYLNAQIRVAGLLARQGKSDEARQYLKAISPKSNQQRVLLIQAEAQILREAKQYQQAFDVLTLGLEKMPNQSELLYDRAMAADKLDKLDVMEKDLRRLIQVKPDNAHAYNALGFSFAERGIRLEEALALIEKAVELSPDDPFIVDSLGWVYYRLGQPEKAAALLRKALILRPDAEISAHLGEVLWVQGKHDEARKVWDAAAKQFPENEALRDVLQKYK
ncbi:MAG: tetratricopeptide repeat protein [Sulfuricellaceae bacterium]|nr:tetratricopeptide repeat protein [Sulfuricellaceae bacterium]